MPAVSRTNSKSAFPGTDSRPAVSVGTTWELEVETLSNLPPARDVLGAIHADDVSADPRSAVGRERDEGARDVGGSRETTGRVHRLYPLDHLLVAGDLPERRRVGDAGSQRVDGNAVRRELDGELPHVRLEHRFRRGHGSVRGPHDVVAGGRHREDPRAGSEQSAEEEVLRPVDERVAHHVDRHLELGLRDRLLPRRREERLQGPEGDRVEEHGNAVLRRLAAARPRDFGDDPVDVRLGALPVEVDPEYVPARPGEGDRAGLAEAGRGSENEGPTGAVLAGQNGADVSTGIARRRPGGPGLACTINSRPGGF